MNKGEKRVEFLTAMLDADEGMARNALHPDAVEPGEWVVENRNSKYHKEPNSAHIAEDRRGHYWSVAHEVFIPNAEHIARHDPARVLREIEAKRRIIGLWAEQPQTFGEMVAHLAEIYSDHPDYREEWKPCGSSG